MAAPRIHSSAIRYFDAVRRAKSIREAARQLNVSASAVNRQLIKLEETLGSPLFDRSSSGLVLTPVGERLARHVINVLQDFDHTLGEIAEIHDHRAGHITVAVVESIASSLLPDVIGHIRARAPKITFQVDVLGSFDIPSAIAGGDVDIGVAFALRKSADLQQVHRTQFRLGAVVPANHPLASQKSVTIGACLAYPLILPTPDLSITNLLEPLMPQRSVTLSPIMTVGSIDLMQRLVLRGHGIAFQTTIGIEPLIEDGSLVHIPIRANGPVWSDLGVYMRSGRMLPNVTDLFVQVLKAEIDRRRDKED